jgi:FtsP/CotA-like multicopper oxidase with cupredoxin domain
MCTSCTFASSAIGASTRMPRKTARGPKDTVRIPPGTRTRIVARFDRPGRFVWHCHILSHEDHEMMRPFVVREV